MVSSNRTFSISKLKNNVKIIDSFISYGEETLLILTSIGRILKFDISNKYIPPNTKQSQGLVLAKYLPTEKIVSCCKVKDEEKIYLISRKGKIFSVDYKKIYYARNRNLGFLNERSQLKNDYFIKMLPSNKYLDIETNKNKSARLNIDNLNLKTNKDIFSINFLTLEKDEYIENCFSHENLFN